MKKIVAVFGTRPEAIKMCPLVNELRFRDGVSVTVCVTGQHREMLDSVLHTFGVEPDADLDVMQEGQSLFDVTEAILCRFRRVLEEEKPDLVLVHGDTTTAFAAALACYYMRIPVGHVEAGLRTYDTGSPYPEEFNRRAVEIISTYDFAPTEEARQNLIREGKPDSRIFVTGNTVIDALETTVRRDYTHPELERIKMAGGRLVLLTAHRRENLGEPMRRMFRAVKKTVEAHPDVQVVYPVHPNPAVREVAHEIFDGCDRIRLIEPLDVVDFHNFLAQSYLILTDSGGIQEEAPALSRPVLVMRDTTERPEGVAAGTLRLVGTGEETIAREFSRLLDNRFEYSRMSHACNPYGDGRASQRIADVIEELELE